MAIDWDRAGCTFVAGLAAASGLLSLGAGICWIGRLGINVVSWIKIGEWPKYAVFDFLHDVGLGLPHTDLVGLQKIIIWLGEQTALWLFFALAVGLYGSFMWIGMASASCFAEIERVRALDTRRQADEEEYSLEDLIAGKEPPKRSD
ncbi:hypothetical protein ACKWRH_38125 [Bradyrhizobium sp. Pa8]|uniref:hypothetical protein n=1 Tax=Bradyrhizobium sp. Pa8 TaxID=3386552 RepID=UPI00403F7309